MGRKQKEKTYIKSIRVNEDIKDFLEQLPNANLFVLQLLENTEEYKKFIAYKKSQSQTGNLFDLPN
jgi:hypothetical protein